MEKRTAKQFSRSEILRIATAYGDPRNDVDYHSFQKEYNIGEHTFRRLLEMAVEKSIASDELIKQMEEKAKFNVERSHEGKGKGQIRDHYKELKSKQAEYLTKRAIEILEAFAESPFDKSEFCKDKVLSEDGMNWILKNYLPSNDISERVFWKIQWKFNRKYLPEKIAKFWEEKQEERKSNQSWGE